jgi:hypothetical protein
VSTCASSSAWLCAALLPLDVLLLKARDSGVRALVHATRRSPASLERRIQSGQVTKSLDERVGIDPVRIGKGQDDHQITFAIGELDPRTADFRAADRSRTIALASITRSPIQATVSSIGVSDLKELS